MAQLPLLIADVYDLAGALRNHGDRLAGTVGQTQARWQVLSVVSDGCWTVSGAARRLGISRQAVQRVAHALAEDGLVRLEPNPDDRRAPLVRLTPAGERTLTTITATATGWHAEVEARLGGTDLASIRRLLRHLLEAVTDGDQDPSG